ncbi:MAG: translation initiation factor IF-2 [Paludibacteraceae bacterium]|nr:translation initiation factor IF-2 [Paludibacteraceae bacterium]
MMARLHKVTTELNIGLDRAVEFLGKKGFEVVANPNTKITDEQEMLLRQAFGADQSVKQESVRFNQQRQSQEKTEYVAIEGYEDEADKAVEEKKVEPEEIKIEIQRPKIIDKIDLDKKTSKKTEETKEVVEAVEEKKNIEEKVSEEKSADPEEIKIEIQRPKVIDKIDLDRKPSKKTKEVEKEEIKETPKVEVPKLEPIIEQKPVEKKEEEVFSFGTPTLKQKIKVVDKIDLNSINTLTRPAKKTKEEKLAEQKEKKAKQEESQVNSNSDKTKKRAKRNRIVDNKKYERVVFQENSDNVDNSKQKKNHPKRPLKPVVSEEDVQKQVKETLARLTSKKVKGAKYRRDKREANLQRQQELSQLEQQDAKTLKLTEFVTANELATMMSIPVTQIISTCMSIGLFVSINQRLDAETINIVAEEFGFKTEYVSAEVVDAIAEVEDKEEDLLPRPPIVTVMGHVDHGKTSLLDHIRNTNVIAGEAGGITQHIGAYSVTLKNGQQITFLDTPGHEAFTAMRARGAKVTDIVIVIVAADDNIMPQTVEAINHASAAGVPIIFAINKIDKPNANPEKVKESLAAMNYLVEDWGGKYQSQDISAKKGTNVRELLEKVLLEAEMLELKANPNRKATGSIIESSLDKGRGYVATVLVQNGTLKVGDVVLAGTSYGRVKAMFNERNQKIKQAGPSEPAIILGLNGAPQAGDNFNVFEQDHEARDIANKREQLQREQGLRTSKHLTLEELGRRRALGDFHELNVIVKGDVDGSIEALSDSLIKLSTEEVQVNVIHKAVGQISESDVMLASASNAIIIGFQVRPSVDARKAAEREEIDIRLYSIIYDAIEELKAAMEGLLSPEIKEEITATIEIRETFKISKVGTIAGCMVKEGKVKRGNKVRLIRDGIVIYTGELASLKRMKDDVKEVSSGFECGLNIANYNDIKVGNIIESFEEVEVKKSL